MVGFGLGEALNGNTRASSRESFRVSDDRRQNGEGQERSTPRGGDPLDK